MTASCYPGSALTKSHLLGEVLVQIRRLSCWKVLNGRNVRVCVRDIGVGTFRWYIAEMCYHVLAVA